MTLMPERGVTITSGELASEGVEIVLDAIVAAGGNAIGLPSNVTVESTAEDGMREPPLDVAGDLRILDRPLWGKRALHVQRYPVHNGDPALWDDLPWNPPAAAPEAIRVDYPRQAIEAARKRNLRVYAQLTPYGLPGSTGDQDSVATGQQLRDELRPQRFIGGPSGDAIAFTGCLNNPVVRQLGRVRVRELLRHYGDVDGLSLDWVEYPNYFIDNLFTCFCDHCRDTACASGHDWNAITTAVRQLWDSVHTLTPASLDGLIESGDWGNLATDPVAIQDGVSAWLEFKAESVSRAIKDIRETMNDAGGKDLLLSANGFSLPWGRMSGASYPREDNGLDSQRPKLYSFHWHMMVRWWAESMLSWNRESQITPSQATAAILALFGMVLEEAPATVTPDMFGMPGPDDSHNLTPDSYTNRIENALLAKQPQAPLMPFIHGYRSTESFASLLQAVRPYTTEGLWVQRYGYLNDDKLAALGREWSHGT